MDLGLSLPQYGVHNDLTRVAEFARAAEAMGYDSLWVGDRLITPTDPSDLYPGGPHPYPPQFTSAPDPLVLWAAAAAATSTVRLAASTLIAPWYHPVLLARALTTVDALSGGRLDVGLGTGWMRDEYTAAGADWATRGARLDETLDVLQAWWASDRVAYHGRFAELPESVVDLRPVQPGGPPIYLGGWKPAALRRVGRRAAGFLGVAGTPQEVQTWMWDVVRGAAEAAGRDPGALKRNLRHNVHDRDVDALAAQLDATRAAGYDSALVDLTSCTTGVDDTLALADALMARVRG